jgi:leucyl aminopeptidase
MDAAEAAQATVEGSLLSQYRFDRYKSATGESTDRSLARLSLVEASDVKLPDVARGASIGEAISAGTHLARDLGNHPANVATPGYLADQARELAARHGMRTTIWDASKMMSEGFGALLSVSAGSVEPPYFIRVDHTPPATEGQSPVVLAGKAITFDSGGISLKPPLRMGRMKYDMGGGAAALGVMEAVGRLGLGVPVTALVAATENLPSGSATKPGDVVTALNGTTIEILNTDAEGRLVLADTLSFAQRLEPRAVVDMATLTGAVLVALGRKAAGMFTNDDALADQLQAAGERSGEKVWRLPLWEDYADMIESDIADIKNTSDVRPAPGGAIFAAKFLERFVDYPWVHLDIAAMAWSASAKGYTSKGATGFGVRLLADWLLSMTGGDLEPSVPGHSDPHRG